MRLSRPGLLLLLAVLSCSSAISQQPPSRDPQALALAGQAMRALTNGLSVNDVTLGGTATRIAGSENESGTAVLKALGTQDSRIDLAFPSGQRTQIRGQTNGSSAGVWSGPDGVVHRIAQHNCWTDAAWFMPPLSSLAALSDPNMLLSYIGHETRGGASVEHIRLWRQPPRKTKIAADWIQRLTTIDLYLDSTSLLPVAMTFNAHPEDDAATDIAVEVRYSDYRSINGLHIPFHLQKFLNNGLVLDIQLRTVSLNTGLSASEFSVQ